MASAAEMRSWMCRSLHPKAFAARTMVVMARLAILAMLLVGGLAYADRPAVDDSRLGGSAADVRAVVDRAAANGLPTELLVDKVREGSGQGRAAGADRARRARPRRQPRAARASRRRPPESRRRRPRCLKAIVEAHAAGVGAGEVATVLRSGGRDRERALQVLTDLAQRGYPVSVAARTVSAIAGRGKNALDHLVGEAERLRSVDAATPGDALDALARADAQGLGLDHAEQLLHRGSPTAPTATRMVPNRETSGNRGPRSGGVAAPGARQDVTVTAWQKELYRDRAPVVEGSCAHFK